MADFNSAIEYVLKNEGGFEDSPNDSGGATNYGISLRFIREIPIERLRKYGIFKSGAELGVQDIKELTIDQAKLIYKGEFWDVGRFEEIVEQLVATYLLDMAVEHGLNEAIKIAQRGTWAFYHQRNDLKDDGIMGGATLDVIDRIGLPLLPVLIASRAWYCELIVERNPKDREFLNGWLNRCYLI